MCITVKFYWETDNKIGRKVTLGYYDHMLESNWGL